MGSSLNGQGTLARTLNTDAGVGGEALLLAVVFVVILKLLAIGGSDAVFGCYTDVSILSLALVDGTLGVGASRLHIHVGFVIHGVVFGKLLARLVVVEVGGSEGDTDLLVVVLAGEDDFLVSGLVLQLFRRQHAVRDMGRLRKCVPRRGCSQGTP